MELATRAAFSYMAKIAERSLEELRKDSSDIDWIKISDNAEIMCRGVRQIQNMALKSMSNYGLKLEEK